MNDRELRALIDFFAEAIIDVTDEQNIQVARRAGIDIDEVAKWHKLLDDLIAYELARKHEALK